MCHHSWLLVSQRLALLGASTAALLCCSAGNLSHQGSHNVEAAGSVPLPCWEGAKTFLKVYLCRNYSNHNEKFLHLPLSTLCKKPMP